MAVRREKTIQVEVTPETAFAASVAALKAMGVKIQQMKPQRGFVYAQTGFSWKSIGEHIEVQITDTGEACFVNVTSESQQTDVWLDYGKNNQNLQRFEQELQIALLEFPQAAAGSTPTVESPAPTASSSLAASKPLVFISYRRQESADVSGRIYDKLLTRFGREAIFKDVDNIPLGVNFKTYLEETVNQCTHLLAIIGRDWSAAVDDEGRRRLDSPNDFVRIEIEAALKRGIPVIPLLVQGATLPEPEDLPDPMRELVYRNGTPIRSDPDFHNDMERLIKALGG